MSERSEIGDQRTESGLRLVWSRPAHLPPPPPRRRVDLALAIQRHLDGHWGLTDDSFAVVFATTAPDHDAVARKDAPRVLQH